MEMDVLFSGSKWEILEELAKNPGSPLELAGIFNTSLANISQQLRFMEALGVVGKTKVSNHEKGKPRAQYFIKDEITCLVRLGKSIAQKQFLKPDPFNTYTCNVLASQNKKDQYFLLKFFWDNPEILSNSTIGIFKNSDEALEFFIITEDVEKARKNLSVLQITSPSNQSKKIVCWTHNPSEIKDGLENKDAHYINLVKETSILLDEGGVLEKFKSEAEK